MGVILSHLQLIKKIHFEFQNEPFSHFYVDQLELFGVWILSEVTSERCTEVTSYKIQEDATITMCRNSNFELILPMKVGYFSKIAEIVSTHCKKCPELPRHLKTVSHCFLNVSYNWYKSLPGFKIFIIILALILVRLRSVN